MSQVRLPHVSSARFLHLPGQTGRPFQNQFPPALNAGKPSWAISEVLSLPSAAAALELEALVGEVWRRVSTEGRVPGLDRCPGEQSLLEVKGHTPPRTQVVP